MRYLAIDPGGKRTGFAVGDDITRIATPVAVVEAASDEARLAAILRAVEENEPGELVLGLPLNMDGSESPGTKQARALASTLTQRTGLTVHLVDERLTSFAAESQLSELDLTRGGKKERRDAIAAALILRDFLERDQSPQR
jgi:putative Holliday junction resolvase